MYAASMGPATMKNEALHSPPSSAGDYTYKLVSRVLVGVIPLLLLVTVAALIVLPAPQNARVATALLLGSFALAGLRLLVVPRIRNGRQAEWLGLFYHLVILGLAGAAFAIIGTAEAGRSFLVITVAAGIFFWAVGNGQFDDLEEPAMIIFDDEEVRE